MKPIQYTKAAVAALALLGSTTLATPAGAVTLSNTVRAAIVAVSQNPTPEERAVLDLMEDVTPGSLAALAAIVRASPDIATLAVNVEAYTALNPSLAAVIENAFATFVADPRLAPLVAVSGCAGEDANPHNLVRIWCGLSPPDPYPTLP